MNTPDGWRDLELVVFAYRERGGSRTSTDYEQCDLLEDFQIGAFRADLFLERRRGIFLPWITPCCPETVAMHALILLLSLVAPPPDPLLPLPIGTDIYRLSLFAGTDFGARQEWYLGHGLVATSDLGLGTSTAGVMWYPMEFLSLSFGLDPLRGRLRWDWSLCF